MRARRREINIFNMSLLDILCGALGAFCFMMLVALPYYKPAGSAKQLREAQAQTEKLMHDIEQMKDRMSDPKSIEEMEALMRRLEAQVKALQGQVNILTAEKEDLQRRMDVFAAENGQLRERVNQLSAEKEQLQAKINQLTAEKEQIEAKNQQLAKENENFKIENQKLTATVRRSKPFVIRALPELYDGQSVEIFLQDDQIAVGGGKSVNAVFDPGAESYRSGWINDITNLRFRDAGAAVWISATTLPGVTYRIFLKHGTGAEFRKNMQVTTIADGDFAESEKIPSVMRLDTARTKILPTMILSRERPWGLLGTLTVDAEAKLTFKAATAEERDQEWRTLMKTAPPPFATPVPAPPRPRPALDSAEMERKRQEALDRRAREREKASPASGEKGEMPTSPQPNRPPPPPRRPSFAPSPTP